MTTPTTPSDDLEAAATRLTEADIARAEELLRDPDAEDNERFASWFGRALLSERLADKARIAELEGERDEEPGEPGAFEGDIFFGDRVHTARGTHRWANGTWERLPSDEEILTDLLGKARARALSAEAAQARAEFLLAVMAAMFDGPHGWWETRRLWHGAMQDNYENAYVEQTVADEWRKRMDAAEAALRASQEALNSHLTMCDEALACVTGFEDDARCIMGNTNFEIVKSCRDRVRQTLAQVEGGGEDKGSIPGPVTDDLRASRGEGSGS